MIQVELDGEAALEDHLVRTRRAMDTALRKIADEAGKVVLELERVEAPKRTGRLATELTYRVFASSNEAEARFYSEPDYTFFVIRGTRPHDIRPRMRRALMWPGAEHPVVFVRHPGTRPDDFPQRALERADSAIDAILDRVGTDIVEGL